LLQLVPTIAASEWTGSAWRAVPKHLVLSLAGELAVEISTSYAA